MPYLREAILMETRLKLIQELVRDSLYPVDESAVASAIIARLRARRTVPDAPFRGDARRLHGGFSPLADDFAS
jgi:hypothetical protein